MWPIRLKHARPPLTPCLCVQARPLTQQAVPAAGSKSGCSIAASGQAEKASLIPIGKTPWGCCVVAHTVASDAHNRGRHISSAASLCCFGRPRARPQKERWKSPAHRRSVAAAASNIDARACPSRMDTRPPASIPCSSASSFPVSASRHHPSVQCRAQVGNHCETSSVMQMEFHYWPGRTNYDRALCWQIRCAPFRMVADDYQDHPRPCNLAEARHMRGAYIVLRRTSEAY